MLPRVAKVVLVNDLFARLGEDPADHRFVGPAGLLLLVVPKDGVGRQHVVADRVAHGPPRELAAGRDEELVEVRVVPVEHALDHEVQLVQRQPAMDFHPPPYLGLAAGERDLEDRVAPGGTSRVTAPWRRMVTARARPRKSRRFIDGRPPIRTA